MALLFALSSIACNLSEPEELGPSPNQNVGDVDAGNGDDDDAGNGDDDDAGNGDDDDAGNGDDDDLIHTEAHQWCVAAERTTDGTVTAFNCVGPHDISGFEASGTETRWQPGAFQVISE